MSKLFTSTLFALFLLFQTSVYANEDGEIERLVVPEAKEDMPQEEAEEIIEVEQEVIEEAPETSEPNVEESEAPQSEESTQEAQEISEAPEAIESQEETLSEDELEAKRAEEAELREVGAGEEPVIE